MKDLKCWLADLHGIGLWFMAGSLRLGIHEGELATRVITLDASGIYAWIWAVLCFLILSLGYVENVTGIMYLVPERKKDHVASLDAEVGSV